MPRDDPAPGPDPARRGLRAVQTLATMMGDRGAGETMRTTCPRCDTAYTIPDDRIGPKGRKVRCTRCGEQWRVTATDLDPVEAFRAEAAEPAADLFAAAEIPSPATPAGDAIDPFDALAAEAEPEETTAAEAPEPFADDPTEPAHEAEAAPPAFERPAEGPPKPNARPHHRRGPHLKLPRMPAAVTRLAPFVGPAVFLVSCLIFAGLVVFRASVVAQVPTLAGFYRLVGLEVNLRGLDFGPIETLREMADGQPVLVVEGSLANTSGTARQVPALRFALRDADAQELYAWSVDPRATVIAAGDRLRFRTRLVAPPERAADLQVRFAERRNRQAGLP